MPSPPPVPERIRWTVELLGVRPDEHLLEIGCGPGHAVALVCERLAGGTITALDRSPVMVARARERSAACIAAGRARIEQRALADADPGRRFDKGFAVNVNAFWTAPAPSFTAVRRLLNPGGALYLAYEPPTEARLREIQDWLPALLREHGFRVDAVHTHAFRKGHGLCVVGTPSDADTKSV